MRTLGAVLAGGRSSRFGSDKAAALLRGLALIDHAIDALRPMSDAIVVVGREDAAVPCVADWPERDRGPLGGLAGALRHAAAFGFDQVLSVSVDSARLPTDLRAALEPAPAFIASQPVIGLWRAGDFDAVAAILAGAGPHSMRAFAERTSARAVPIPPPPNINTQADLARLSLDEA